jgi:hypothetical protein
MRGVGRILLVGLISSICSLAAVAVPTGPRGHVQAQDAEFDDFDDFQTRQNREPSAAEIAIMVIFYAVVFVIVVGIQIFILYMLYSFLNALPPQFRLMEPGMVWLLLIPCFNLVWNFYVFVRISRSYRNYFNAHGRYEVGDCGETVGMWYAICVCLSIIPCLGVFAGIASLVLLIIYMVKLNGFKTEIQHTQPKPMAGPQF